MFKLFKRKKPITVMRGKKFVAAYSEYPFVEAKSGADYPDFSFHESGGLYWCVRVGDIDIPWGIGGDDIGFKANGFVKVSRRNVSAVTFDGRGFEYKRVGDVFYLYESELGDDGFFGFSPFMQRFLIRAIKGIAKQSTDESFRANVERISEVPEIAALLEEHKLIIRSVNIDMIATDS